MDFQTEEQIVTFNEAVSSQERHSTDGPRALTQRVLQIVKYNLSNEEESHAGYISLLFMMFLLSAGDAADQPHSKINYRVLPHRV